MLLLLLFSSSGEYHVATIAGGGGRGGYRDGEGSQAQFNGPRDCTVDEHNNIIVADADNHCIRMISHNRY